MHRNVFKPLTLRILWGVNVYPKEKINVCPRCGLPFSYVKSRRRGGKVYYYAVHYLGYERVGGRVRKNVRECYLGPEFYDYVSRLHVRERLILKGLVDTERALSYLDALINIIPQLELEKEMRRKLAERFRRLAEKLEKGVEEE